eukprot:2461064-Prymnesium_polylepis.1
MEPHRARRLMRAHTQRAEREADLLQRLGRPWALRWLAARVAVEVHLHAVGARLSEAQRGAARRSEAQRGAATSGGARAQRATANVRTR